MSRNVWRIFFGLLFFVFLIFGITKIETLLHPNMVSKVENMLERSYFAKCTVSVDREDRVSLRISVQPIGKPSVSTEFYDYFINDLSTTEDETILFSHTINQHPNGTFYLTQTRIWADADMKLARRVAVEYCDHLKNPDGRVTYDGPRPVYQCAVPVKRATCFATERAGDRAD